MRVCFFGTYNRGHTVNRIYRAAVRDAGYEVVEIHEPLWEETRDKSDSYFGPFNLAVLAVRWCAKSVRLASRWWKMGGAPAVVIGFNGQLDLLLIRLITGRRRPRIVFAPLVCLTETLVDDRAVYSDGSIGHRLLTALDRLTCRLADTVVVDTEAHADYFRDRLGVDPRKLEVFRLGVDDSAYAGREDAGSATLGEPGARKEVLYVGHYHPLHGVDVIARAVELLADREDLSFTFIGTGRDRSWFEPRVRVTGAQVQFEDWVPYEQLAQRIGDAAVVLGIFGSSAKAQSVIPNKAYEAAAAGRPLVSADSPAMREVFVDRDTAILCERSGESLAAAIEELADDPDTGRRIGRAAAGVMRDRFGADVAAIRWCELVSGGDERLMPYAYQDGLPELGVAIVHYNSPEAATRCLESLERSTYPRTNILLVDNASTAANLSRLEELMAGRFDARIERLETNIGYAGGNNLALSRLFDQGCENVLVLNPDTVVTPDAAVALVRAQREAPYAGPIGPRVARDWPGAPAASLGERFVAVAAWLPRTFLRYRFPRQRPYPVSGVLGCAMLISRRLFERSGGFDERYFAYYEEVDLCIRARELGFAPTVEPAAEIAHSGHRGFGGGLSEVAAYLKARNLWLLGCTATGAFARPVFAFGYAVMLAVSAAGYALRGQPGLVARMAAGARSGLAGETGAPPEAVLSGYTPDSTAASGGSLK